MGSKFAFGGVRFHVAAGKEPVEAGEFVLDMQGLALRLAGYGISIPTRDFGLPLLNTDDWSTILGIVRGATDQGRTIRISCTAGLGRSGTVLAILLAGLSPYSSEDPVEMARDRRPGAVETEEQEAYARAMGTELRAMERSRRDRLTAEDARYRAKRADLQQAQEDRDKLVVAQAAELAAASTKAAVLKRRFWLAVAICVVLAAANIVQVVVR